MSGNPYERVKGGRLTFKGGDLASRSKTIDKKKKKKKQKQQQQQLDDVDGERHTDDVLVDEDGNAIANGDGNPSSGEIIYTIDAAKKMKYEHIFPVETKKFGYDPNLKAKSIEQALDDRVKKKADRYCK